MFNDDYIAALWIKCNEVHKSIHIVPRMQVTRNSQTSGSENATRENNYLIITPTQEATSTCTSSKTSFFDLHSHKVQTFMWLDIENDLNKERWVQEPLVPSWTTAFWINCQG